MTKGLSRRAVLGALGSAAAHATRPRGILIDTHIHLFAADQRHFPYHQRATYKPAAQPLEPYLAFVRRAGIDHVVVVHPEPYQDDHRYLEYCFQHEPSAGFFKGTCLFDPISPKTPGRMEELMHRWPHRIVALRIHETRPPGAEATTAGPIRDRDLTAPAMRETWAAAHRLGLAIQMHFVPHWAPQIGALAKEFPGMPVILDHLGRAGQGAGAEYDGVLRLARLPRVYMKFSGVSYSSKEPWPHRDAKPLVRRAFDAFGPARMIWGGLGMDMASFDKAVTLFEEMFAFASESDRTRIRGLNAKELYGFG